MLLAHIVLAKTYTALEDETAAQPHSEAVRELTRRGVAAWARNRAEEELA
jgi:hypothetical protein